MKSSGLTSAFGGNLAIMDIYAAQKMFGRGRKFDRIDLGGRSRAGRSRDAEAELGALLGPGFQVEPPSGRGQQFEAMLAAYSMMVEHLEPVRALHRDVHHLQLVRHRRDRSGDRRSASCARSARRARQIRWLFLGESAVTGLIGSLGGLAFGVLIARGIAASIGTLISDVYGVAQHADELATSPGLLAAGAGDRHRDEHHRRRDSGAQRGARRSGAGAAEGQVSGAVGRREPGPRDRSAAVLGAVSIVCLVARRRRGRSSTSATCWRSSSRCCSARCCRWRCAKAIRPVLKWLRPVEGALAADSLIQAPRRTSASVAALMLSLALVVAFAGMARASYDSIIDWMETALNPDLFVMPSQNIVVRTIRFPATMAPELAAIPGVERVQMVRDARIVFRETPVMIVAVEVDEHRRDGAPRAGRGRRRRDVSARPPPAKG